MFDGIRIVYKMRNSAKARVAHGREVLIGEQIRFVHVTMLTPWAPVEVKLTLATLPGVDDVVIIGSKSVRCYQGVDVRATLKNKLTKGATTKVSPDEEVTLAASCGIAGGITCAGKEYPSLSIGRPSWLPLTGKHYYPKLAKILKTR